MEKSIALSLGLALLGFIYLHYPSVYGISISPLDPVQWQHMFNSIKDVSQSQISVTSDKQIRIIPFQGEEPIQDDQGLGPNDQGLGPNDQGLGPNDQGLGPNDQGLPDEQTLLPSEPSTQASDISNYKARVTFHSITVHNNHETTGGGDGEYDLFAYVQGKGVDLTKLSQFGGNPGLRDVSDGETVQFLPGANFVNVDLDNMTPLYLFTVGTEDDGCGKLPLPGFLQSYVNSKILNETRQKGGEVVGGVIGGIYGGAPGAAAGKEFGPQLQKLSNDLTTKFLGKISCKLNANDDIGKVVQTFDPPRFGVGAHADPSDAKDFTLRYTIVATRAP
jgi:hypothetical protein